MKIAVIGGGITGLTSAFKLSKKGHKVYVYERGKALGGLAAGFRQKNWQWNLENFYHHIFTSDNYVIGLIKELELEDKLIFNTPKTSIYRQGKTFRFDSPVSLLKAPLLNPIDKTRAAFSTQFLKMSSDWKSFEKQKAVDWLKKYYGNNCFDVLWRPLLKGKFGNEYEKVNMAWFWARIKKRSQSLGYMEGGFQVLVDRLADEIKKNGGEIITNHPAFSHVEQGRDIFPENIRNKRSLDCARDDKKDARDDKKSIRGDTSFDKVIFTGSNESFAKTYGNKLPKNYQNKLLNHKMLGAICLTLELKSSFLDDGTYWLNVNESGFPFIAVVEHTNFVDKKYYGGNHILYVGGYYPQNHRYFKMDKKAILAEWLPFLKKINPNFNFLFLKSYFLNLNLSAQPVVYPNHSTNIMPLETPILNVYLANMQQVYPWDRGINYAVELGEKVVDLISKDCHPDQSGGIFCLK